MLERRGLKPTRFSARRTAHGVCLLHWVIWATSSIRRAPRAGRRGARRITHADLPPSLLARLDPAAASPDLRTIVIGGEVCPPEVVRAWARRARVVNVYGPTEATVCTSLAVCNTNCWDRPSIGRPI